MNIVQLHDRVRFWIDTVGSTRFDSDDIDRGINIAINEIVDEKYDHSRLNHRGDVFQKTQRLRDELGDLVKQTESTAVYYTLTAGTGYVLLSGKPPDYAFMLALALYVGSDYYSPAPLSYDRLNVIQDNPFRRVRETPKVQCYYIEDSTGIKILHPESLTPTKVEVYYLARPTDVFYGYEKGPADSIGLLTNFITALSPTSYKSTEYVSGTALTTDGVDDKIDYGLAVTDYVNPEINGMLHEEVARRAALNCLLSAGNMEKYQTLKAEVMAP